MAVALLAREGARQCRSGPQIAGGFAKVSLLRRVIPESLGPVHYVAMAVLLIRLFVLVRLSGSAAFLPHGGDMQFYDEWALRIARNELSDGRAFYGLPLYPYLLGFFYWAFGHNSFLPVLLQVLADTGTAVLLFQLALVVFHGGEGVLRHRATIIGIAAALGWAMFLPAQAFAVVLMPTTLVVFAFWFVVWRVVQWETAPGAGEALLLGLCIGIAGMAVATILFLIPLVLSVLLLRNARGAAPAAFLRGGRAALLLLLGVALGTSPAWLHNSLVAQDRVFLSAHGGVNFWMGNNPEATGYPTFPSGLRAGQATMLQDSIKIAELAAGRSLPRSEVAQFWSWQGRAWISQNPAAWARLLLRKIHNFWNAFSYDDVSIIGRLREEGALLPGPGFGLIAALGLPGLCLSVWRFPASRWMAAAITLHMLAVLPVFVTERYRLAAAPGLILFAVAGLWMFWEAVVRREHARTAVYLLVALGATFWISTPPARAALWALELYHAGTRALERQDLSKAREQLQLARAYSPQNIEVQFALGNVALAEARIAEAQQHYRTVLAADPRHQGALNNLGFSALDQRDFTLAVQCFTQAAHQEPQNAKAHYLLARALVGIGNRAAARAHIARALQLLPDQSEFQELEAELIAE